MNPSISIIVPVYNAEKTLNRCVDSILSQTFQDWELLLIDDGSTDRSGEFCDKYASKDQRIKVFHKTNSGVSSARNIGLDYAKGEWVVFVDADDFVKEPYLTHLLEHSQKQVDLVISYAEIHDGNDIRKESYPSKLVDDTNFESMFIENDMHWHTSPWSKLYKRSIIEKHHLRFCEGMHIGEDAVFLYSYMLYSNKIYKPKRSLTHGLYDRPDFHQAKTGYHRHHLPAQTSHSCLLFLRSHPVAVAKS